MGTMNTPKTEDEDITSEFEDSGSDADEIIDETEEVIDDVYDDEDAASVEIDEEWETEYGSLAEDKKIQVPRRSKAEKIKKVRTFQGSPLRSEPDSDID